MRPDLDNTQLFELMRRSATDIGPPGFDTATGYGLLDIPTALSFRTPARDPGEPNEKPNEIEPHGLFPAGTPPLTWPGLRSKVSIWLGPPFIHRRMQAFWRVGGLTAAWAATRSIHPDEE